LDRTMKNKKPNAELVWKQLEDQLVPRLGLSLIDRTVYAHLLRHSHLEGKLRLRFSIRWLARNIRLSSGPVRQAVRRLVAHGALAPGPTGARRGTWWRCGCPRRFGLRSWMASRAKPLSLSRKTGRTPVRRLTSRRR